MDQRFYYFIYLILFIYVLDVYREKGYWNKHENRRQFLIDLATSKGFDPFNPDTWTDHISRQHIEKAKVCYSLIIYLFN